MPRFTPKQRERIKRAACDARDMLMLDRGLDVVDIACSTDNYWWTGLDDRGARIALRFIHQQAKV